MEVSNQYNTFDGQMNLNGRREKLKGSCLFVRSKVQQLCWWKDGSNISIECTLGMDAVSRLLLWFKVGHGLSLLVSGFWSWGGGVFFSRRGTLSIASTAPYILVFCPCCSRVLKLHSLECPLKLEGRALLVCSSTSRIPVSSVGWLVFIRVLGQLTIINYQTCLLPG